MKYYKKITTCLFISMIGSIYAQDNIINEIAKGGKFIVRDIEQNEAMVIDDGNVRFSGTLKLGVLPEGDISNSIVVWDQKDKLFKILDQSLRTGLAYNIKNEDRPTVGNDSSIKISASIQSTTLWTESGSSVYRNDGNVGIGTTNPSAKLDVNGTVSVKRYVIDGLYDITNGVWDLSRGNLAQVTYNSSITPITINSDGTAGTYVLVVKKSNSCTDCNINFLGADVKYPGGVNPTLSSGSNTTDIFSFIAVGNNTFYCFYAKNLQ